MFTFTEVIVVTNGVAMASVVSRKLRLTLWTLNPDNQDGSKERYSRIFDRPTEE